MQDAKSVETELTDKAVEVLHAQELLENSEEFKRVMEQKAAIDEQLKSLKEELKENMLKYNILRITSPKGKDDWEITCSKAHSVAQDSTPLDEIDPQYITEKELNTDDLIIRDGKVFKREANTLLVKNMAALNVELPKGFVEKITPRISIKVNSKTVKIG